MKNYSLILLITAACLSCKKETAKPVQNTEPLPHNIYNFRVTDVTDSSVVKINGNIAQVSNIGNRQNYIINAGETLDFYYSFSAGKKRLGPVYRTGMNLDSLINYYTNNPDVNSTTNFAIWNANAIPAETIKNFYPKQRMIINGADTTYKLYIKGIITY